MNENNYAKRRTGIRKAIPQTVAVSAGSDSGFQLLFLPALFLLLFFCLADTSAFGFQKDAQAAFSLKVTIHQVDDGRIKRKVRVPSFETVEAPVGKAAGALDRGVTGRNLFQGTGEVGNLKQIYMRDSVTYTEITPVVFLRDLEDRKTTQAGIAEKGLFSFENLPAGEYLLSIEVPGHTPVTRNVSVGPDQAESKNEVKFNLSFQPSDPEEPRLLREHYNPESISSGARSDYDRAVKALEEARLDDALAFLELAVERDAYFTEAYERMGLIHLSQGILEKAEECFRKALAADPYSYRSLSNLGTILLNRAEAEEAFKYNQLAVKIRPQDPQARYHLAMSFYQLGQLEEALDQLAREKALEPSHFTQPQILSAEIYRLLNDFDSMIMELEEFLERYPEDGKTAQVSQALADARQIRTEN